MKRTVFSGLIFLLILTGLFAITACSKDDDTAKEQAKKDEQIIKDYLAENEIDAQRHESGMYYLITKEGTGDQPTSTSRVEVFYKGYLTNGNVFDETTQGSVIFNLQGLIEAWKIGIPLLKEGGSGTFFVPSALGYGSSAVGSIPANSVLIFEIDLVAVL